MAGSGNAGNRQPKFAICTNPDLRCAHFDVLRHGGVKIEAYSVAQAREKKQNCLRSVDVASYRVLRSNFYVWDVPSATANQRFAVISKKSISISILLRKAEVRVAGYLTRDDCSAPGARR
jgi:hypothetical protein